jgi:hypothetical protein
MDGLNFVPVVFIEVHDTDKLYGSGTTTVLRSLRIVMQTEFAKNTPLQQRVS